MLRSSFFFFNDTATTEISTLSLHDALPIYSRRAALASALLVLAVFSLWNAGLIFQWGTHLDRKSTRLNSSHANISYAVFCLKKKKTNRAPLTTYDSAYFTKSRSLNCMPKSE